jgi:hypothetical protein
LNLKLIRYILPAHLLLPLCAAPIGNPSAPSLLEQGFFIPDTSWTNFQSGVLGDWLAEQRFRPRTSSQSFGLHKAELRGESQLGYATWNIAERLNIQIEMGSGRFDWRWKQSGNQAIVGHLSGGMLWNGSAKLVIFEIKDVSLAADVHAGGWDWMKGHATSNGSPLKGIAHSELRYWQAGAALCMKFQLFIPYIGVGANRTRLKVSHLVTGTGWLRSRHTIGPFLGCTLSKGTDISLNVEWRGGFEQGTSLSGQIRF